MFLKNLHSLPFPTIRSFILSPSWPEHRDADDTKSFISSSDSTKFQICFQLLAVVIHRMASIQQITHFKTLTTHAAPLASKKCLSFRPFTSASFQFLHIQKVIISRQFWLCHFPSSSQTRFWTLVFGTLFNMAPVHYFRLISHQAPADVQNRYPQKYVHILYQLISHIIFSFFQV